MTVETLFTLDERLLVAAKERLMGGEAGSNLAQNDQVLTAQVIWNHHKVALPSLYWLDRSLRYGVVDNLVKLNPALMPDASVHSYHLAQLYEDIRFQEADSVLSLAEVFNLRAALVRQSVIGEELPIVRTLFGQFGGYCLYISQPNRSKGMALGLITAPDTTYVFDASIGLFKMRTPKDLANILSVWLESDQSIWRSAHYQLWRVTL